MVSAVASGRDSKAPGEPRAALCAIVGAELVGRCCRGAPRVRARGLPSARGADLASGVAVPWAHRLDGRGVDHSAARSDRQGDAHRAPDAACAAGQHSRVAP
eukprot:Amastigsp_a847020_18.p4 type:complete len:102 gc:universal Amastigsp_a847020_18:500-805(+)